MKIKQRLAWFILAISFSMIVAAVESPVVMLDGIANRVLSALKREHATLKTNPNAVYRIIDTILLPHVDVAAMSRSVLGRNAWRGATATQRQRFGKEFTRVVTRTYATALANYTDEKIEFLPLRGGYQGQSRVKVKSYIIRSDGPRIPISYRVILRGGRWKVYDMSVDGVSLLHSFRSQFAAELSRGNLDALIKKLHRRNQGSS